MYLLSERRGILFILFNYKGTFLAHVQRHDVEGPKHMNGLGEHTPHKHSSI